MGRLKFYNTGPNQVPGLIVMSLSDKVPTLPDLDPAREQIVVLFNATDEPQVYTIAELAGQGFRLHPVQTNSADPVVRGAWFNPQTGAFTVPARTTAVFVQGEKTTITIQKVAQPKSVRNFKFVGDLGKFKLDDPAFNDHDPYGNRLTFTVQPGTYRVAEELPSHWYLTSIVCDVPGRGTVNLAQLAVAIRTYPGDQITCTFTNGFGASIWTLKYYDKNGDGSWLGDRGLKDWEDPRLRRRGRSQGQRHDERQRQGELLVPAAGELHGLRNPAPRLDEHAAGHYEPELRGESLLLVRTSAGRPRRAVLRQHRRARLSAGRGRRAGPAHLPGLLRGQPGRG